MATKVMCVTIPDGVRMYGWYSTVSDMACYDIVRLSTAQESQVSLGGENGVDVVKTALSGLEFTTDLSALRVAYSDEEAEAILANTNTRVILASQLRK